MSKIKTHGFVETPEHIAAKMVDNLGCIYSEGSILELASGQGAIARVILNKLIEKHQDEEKGRKEFNDRVTLIELDPGYKPLLEEEFPGCKIVIGDALTNDYGQGFDFVISNPPYIRIHNLNEETKSVIREKFSDFCTGMYDIYQAFYQLGISLLNPQGKMTFIAPNSWITTSGTRPMREWFSKNRVITSIEDFGPELVFKGVGTYTAIVNVQEGTSSPGEYPWEFVGEKKGIFPVVKTGVATLLDKAYFGEFGFKEPVIKPALKASTGGVTSCIYPYDEEGNLISEEEFKENSPLSYEWLCGHKEMLAKRSIPADYPWYAYGRSQGLKDMGVHKAVISPINKEGELRFTSVGPEFVVYSGMFIPSVTAEQEEALHSEELLEYLSKCAGHRAGGYRTVSSKNFKEY